MASSDGVTDGDCPANVDIVYCCPDAAAASMKNIQAFWPNISSFVWPPRCLSHHLKDPDCVAVGIRHIDFLALAVDRDASPTDLRAGSRPAVARVAWRARA